MPGRISAVFSSLQVGVQNKKKGQKVFRPTLEHVHLAMINDRALFFFIMRSSRIIRSQ